MVSGVRSEEAEISTFGFSSTSAIATEDKYDYKAPSGAIVKALESIAQSSFAVGYRLVLQSDISKNR